MRGVGRYNSTTHERTPLARNSRKVSMSDVRHWREPIALQTRPVAYTGVRIVDEILARRGLVTAQQVQDWLEPNLSRDCAAAEISGMERVLTRIGTALRTGETILIFGDYDCDGVTSTAILYMALSCAMRSGGTVSWRLPKRADGYGLRAEIVDEAAVDHVSLLIAVDCGSNDLDVIAHGTERGVDVVVIDHHQLSVDVPVDAALVNPQRDDLSALRNVTAAGLAYLMVVCLARDGFQVAPDGKDERVYLDLAAIGTIGDVGALHGLNRAIVREGIVALRATRRQGLRALARHTKVDLRTATSDTVSFKLSPKLNAPGRIDSPDIALRLLLAPDMDSADELARAVIACDDERRTRSELVAAEVAAVLAQAETLPPVIVLAGEEWPAGLLGPVATKVAEQYGRPAVILGGTGEYLSGSGRSVGSWDLAAAFQQIAPMLHRYGGHARAAGLSIERGLLDDLRSALSGLYERSGAMATGPTEIQIDADCNGDGISLEVVRALERLGPFGAGNERPILRWRKAEISRWEPVGRDKSHAQLWLRDTGTAPLRAIYFGGAQAIAQLATGQRIDALLEVSLGVWRNADRVDVRVIDLQPVV